MTRRALFKRSGFFIFSTLLTSKALSHIGGSKDIDIQNNMLISESGPGRIVKSDFAHHHHFAALPFSIIENPPSNGITIATGWANFENPLANFGVHYHSIKLTYQNLMDIKNGLSVIVEDTVKDHEYVFSILKN